MVSEQQSRSTLWISKPCNLCNTFTYAQRHIDLRTQLFPSPFILSAFMQKATELMVIKVRGARAEKDPFPRVWLCLCSMLSGKKGSEILWEMATLLQLGGGFISTSKGWFFTTVTICGDCPSTPLPWATGKQESWNVGVSTLKVSNPSLSLDCKPTQA